MPDSLDALLDHVAQGTEFHFESGLCGDWALTMPSPEKVGLHLVTEGRCWFGVTSDKQGQYPLNAGDIIFVNRHVSHFLSRSKIPNDVSLANMEESFQPRHEGHGMICYDINSHSTTADSIFHLLPAWLIIPASAQTIALKHIINMMREEVRQAKQGYRAVINRLSDVLSMQLLRAVIDQGGELSGPLAALQDSHLRPVVEAIIAEPGHEWTVQQAASRAYLSMSAFAERCQKHTGLSPKKLIDQLRLQRARLLLKGSDLSIEQVAQQLGYQSTTAFSRFIKRYTSLSASEYRQQPTKIPE